MPRVPSPTPIHFDVPAAAVERVAVERLGAAPSDDGRLIIADGAADEPGFTITLAVSGDGDHSSVEVRSKAHVPIPFFAWFFAPIFAAQARRLRNYTIARLQAALTGAPEPPDPKPVFGMPPVAFTPSQAHLLATASAATAVVAFGGALFGQFSAQISHTYGASNADLTVALAITRIGALFALIPTALADRRGRRVSILIGVVGSAAACLLSAAAPSLALFTVAQTFQRALLYTTATVAAIAVIEEAPEGARAYAASMLALAGGLGFSLSVVTLPFGDLGNHGWRIPFVIGAASVVLVRPIMRLLRETTRYTTVAARNDVRRGRLREIFAARYGRRFVLLAVIAFLTNIFSAPSSSLTNKYLEDVRGFSSTGVAIFRTVSTAVPGLVGVLIGGRLAEARGRRPVAVIGLAVATATQMVFFLTGGVLIWFMAAISVFAAGAGGIALGTLDAELFATEVRSTSNAYLTIFGVMGSAVGFAIAGFLANTLGNLGRSIAIAGVGTLIAALVFVPMLPESGARALDDVSPTEEYGPGP
jgi:MFS family permease